jgi:hypothetical protein
VDEIKLFSMNFDRSVVGPRILDMTVTHSGRHDMTLALVVDRDGKPKRVAT